MRCPFKFIVLIVGVLSSLSAAAQNNVGINTETPDASAVLDVVSTNKGMLVPRLTALQRDAIASPATGLLIYNTTDNRFWFYDGGSWEPFLSNGLGDNLGDHVATENLNLNGNYLSGNGADNGVFINSSGKVGIGTSTPNYSLDINGTLDATYANGSGLFHIGREDGFNLLMDNNEILARNNGAASTLAIQADGGEVTFHNNLTDSEKVIIDANGNMGVGVATPADKLHIHGGNIRLVNSNNTSNYISFEPNIFNSELKLTRDGTTSGLTVESGIFEAAQEVQTGKVVPRYDSGGQLNIGNSTSNTANTLVFPVNIQGNNPQASSTSNNNGSAVNINGGIGVNGGTNGAVVLNQQSDGKVGVGTSDPKVKLDISPTIISGAKNTVLAVSGSLGAGSTKYEMGLGPYRHDGSNGGYFSAIGFDKKFNNIQGHTGDLYFSTSPYVINSYAAPVEHMRITNAGNVGIGTSAPSGKLEVVGKTRTTQFQMTNGGGLNKVLVSDASGNATWTDPSAIGDNLGDHTATENIALSGNWLSNTGNDKGAFVATDGKIGVNTNSPEQTLTVNGTIGTTFQGAVRTITSGSGLSLDIAPTVSGGWAREFQFSHNNVDVASMGYKGNGANPGYLYFSANHPGGSAHNTPHMVIDKDGDVGIGVIAPSASLHVNGTFRLVNGSQGANKLLLSDASGFGTWADVASINDGNGIYSGSGTTPSNVAVGVTDDITFDGGTFYIDGANNSIGVGTTTPSTKLEVKGARSMLIDPSGVSGQYGFINQANLGGWAMYHGYKGSAGTNLGGFGALGSYDNLTRFFIGTSVSDEKMSILSNGNVGINMASPQVGLHLKNNSGLRIEESDPSFARAINITPNYAGASGAKITSTSGGNLDIGIDNTDVLSLHKSGTELNVGIGITSPTSRLHIKSISTASTPIRVTNAAGQDIIKANENGVGDGTFDLLRSNGEIGLHLTTKSNSHSYFDAGNFGIGTTAPDAKLEVANGAIRLTDNHNVEWGDASTHMDANSTDDYWRVITTSNERMRVDASGNVGIGTPAPETALDVAGPLNIRFSPALVPTASSTIGIGRMSALPTASSGVFMGWMSNAADVDLSAGTFGFVGRTDVPRGFRFYVGTTPTSVLDIDQSGEVGIGINNAASILQVKTDGDVYGTGHTGKVAIFGDRDAKSLNIDNDEIQAQDNGAASYLILNQNGGNVGIGTTAAPTAKLEVVDKIQVSGTSPEVSFFTSQYYLKRIGTSMNLRAGSTVSLQGNILNFKNSASSATYGVWNSTGLGIGTSSPTEKLEVNGSIKMTDTNQGEGKIMVSDADGKARWANVGSASLNFVSITSNYTATTDDDIIYVDANTASITLTLPSASSQAGRQIKIKKIDATGNVVTIDGNGAETIDGSASQSTNIPYAGYVLSSDGSQWFIVGRI